MSKSILNFEDVKVTNSTFHNSELPTDINEADIKKILISDNVS